MACSFVAGSTSFHKPTLKSHDQSIKHLACVKYTRLQDKSSSVAQTVSKIQEKVGDGHQGTIDIMVSKMNREKSIYFQTSKSFQVCSECRILH
jgi:hypothetical protein